MGLGPKETLHSSQALAWSWPPWFQAASRAARSGQNPAARDRCPETVSMQPGLPHPSTHPWLAMVHAQVSDFGLSRVCDSANPFGGYVGGGGRDNASPTMTANDLGSALYAAPEAIQVGIAGPGRWLCCAWNRGEFHLGDGWFGRGFRRARGLTQAPAHHACMAPCQHCGRCALMLPPHPTLFFSHSFSSLASAGRGDHGVRHLVLWPGAPLHAVQGRQPLPWCAFLVAGLLGMGVP